jgi:adenylosuccinate synthase
MKRAIIVQGLGFGDEGKGATVDFLARELSADLVIRYCGGSQAGHNVELPGGRRHTFSQFGAGTLGGAATYLGEQMIIYPAALQREADHLRLLTHEDPFDSLCIHPRALVTTPYHQALNRLRELSRGASRHGSCGHGIGETRSYWLKHGRDAIVAADLQDVNVLQDKLELLRQRALIDAQSFIDAVPADLAFHANALKTPAGELARELQSLGGAWQLSPVVPSFRTALFEGAQGVLLDEWRGFHPHTTWSTVTLAHALALVAQCGVTELCTLGLTRTYATRHGAGPFPTHEPNLAYTLSDPGNPSNDWQGDLRFGYLDMVLLRYAAACCDGPLDGLVINHLDEWSMAGGKFCANYRYDGDRTLDRLPVAPAPSLAAQERITDLLQTVTPTYEQATPEALCQRLTSELAPLAITANGPTWRDRTLHELRFRTLHAADAELCLPTSTENAMLDASSHPA